MITELISVGTEILLGNIVNTNSAYLSEKCALLGLSVYYQFCDHEKKLLSYTLIPTPAWKGPFCSA